MFAFEDVFCDEVLVVELDELGLVGLDLLGAPTVLGRLLVDDLVALGEFVADVLADRRVDLLRDVECGIERFDGFLDGLDAVVAGLAGALASPDGAVGAGVVLVVVAVSAAVAAEDRRPPAREPGPTNRPFSLSGWRCRYQDCGRYRRGL